MIYKSYDDALLTIVKSTKDLELVIFIRDMFTYRQMEIQKRKLVKGGFILMYYKSYEQITESVITSNKDLKLFHWITNQFTKNRIESAITHTACTVDVSQPKFSKFVKQLVELNYLCRVSRGIYRLNPFVYVPYQSNAETLQAEWLTLIKENT